MLPKEKAKQLVDMMGFSTSSTINRETGEYQPVYRNQYAKECALKAVDEIMSFMKNDDEESDTCYWANHPTLNYLIQVKQEIQKL